MSTTHTTHQASRERNQKFAEFIRSQEVQQQLKNMNKSKCLAFLRDAFKDKYNVTIPPSAAYKVIQTVDERFKPKQRTTTPKATWTATPADTSNESVQDVLNETTE